MRFSVELCEASRHVALRERVICAPGAHAREVIAIRRSCTRRLRIVREEQPTFRGTESWLSEIGDKGGLW